MPGLVRWATQVATFGLNELWRASSRATAASPPVAPQHAAPAPNAVCRNPSMENKWPFQLVNGLVFTLGWPNGWEHKGNVASLCGASLWLSTLLPDASWPVKTCRESKLFQCFGSMIRALAMGARESSIWQSRLVWFWHLFARFNATSKRKVAAFVYAQRT